MRRNFRRRMWHDRSIERQLLVPADMPGRKCFKCRTSGRAWAGPFWPWTDGGGREIRRSLQ